jgi:hypothetical protein
MALFITIAGGKHATEMAHLTAGFYLLHRQVRCRIGLHILSYFKFRKDGREES